MYTACKLKQPSPNLDTNFLQIVSNVWNTCESGTVQDITSFTRVSRTDTVFGARDVSLSALGSPISKNSNPKSGIGTLENQQALIHVDIERASVWLPDSSIYILAALAANVTELCKVVSRRSSGEVVAGATSKV